MTNGKKIRLARILRGKPHQRRSLIIPMDHGVSSGPLPGLDRLPATLAAVLHNGADAVLGHRLLFDALADLCGGPGGEAPLTTGAALLHLSASTDLSPAPNRKVLTATVEDALRLGADGVSIHVNLGDPHEAEMLADFGLVARRAANWGLPLLAMLYARGPGISNAFDPKVVAHCARVGAELGADLVKVLYTGEPESFSRICAGCGVPLLVAGGPASDDPEGFFRMVYEALQAGSAGVSIGRNVFQHPQPGLITAALRGLVHEGLTPDQVLADLRRQAGNN